jgi:hypothetical protein
MNAEHTYMTKHIIKKTSITTLLLLCCTYSYAQKRDEINGISAYSCTEAIIVADETDNMIRKWAVTNRCRTVGIVASLKKITKTYKIGSEDTTYTIKDTTINYIAPKEIIFLCNEDCTPLKGNIEKCTCYLKWSSTFK